MQYRDYYKILGVPRSASADEIKRSYRKLARKFHPDVSKEKNAEARFKEVAEAYEVLRDAEKRASYDQLGSEYVGGQQFRPPPGFGGTSFRARGGGGAADPGFSDFFSSLFGDAAFGGGPGPGMGAAPRRRGEDRRARLELSLEEAYRGTSREVRLQEQEAGPDGQPAGRERTLRVQVPAGVTAGQVIRLAGQGNPGRAGAGDLLFEVAIDPGPDYTLEGRDVTRELALAPWEAALGATVSTPTLGGAVDLRVPAGARTGQKMRLRGRGLPGDPPGDHYVVLRIVLPPSDTPRARELWEEMARELAFDPRAVDPG
jgi:curved DNA-binding protein